VRERLEAAKLFPATDYIKAMRIRSILMKEMEAVFRQCDVMAVPGNQTVANRLESRALSATDVRPGPVTVPGGNTWPNAGRQTARGGDGWKRSRSGGFSAAEVTGTDKP